MFQRRQLEKQAFFCCFISMFAKAVDVYCIFNPKQAGGGGVDGIRPQAGSSLCCAETVSSRKLKLSDCYYILIGFHFEYTPVPWDIHCCHGNAIVEECLVQFRKLQFFAQIVFLFQFRSSFCN